MVMVNNQMVPTYVSFVPSSIFPVNQPQNWPENWRPSEHTNRIIEFTRDHLHHTSATDDRLGPGRFKDLVWLPSGYLT